MDLPLSQWAPPSAEVIPFPCRKRVGKIRRTVQMVTAGSAKSRDAYWRRAIADMAGQMKRAGIPNARIEIELASFEAEVSRLVEGQAYSSGRARPGGDAA